MHVTFIQTRTVSTVLLMFLKKIRKYIQSAKHKPIWRSKHVVNPSKQLPEYTKLVALKQNHLPIDHFISKVNFFFI